MPICSTCGHHINLADSSCSECRAPVEPAIHAYLLAIHEARAGLARLGSALQRAVHLAQIPAEAAELRDELTQIGDPIEDLTPPPGYELAHASFRHGIHLFRDAFDSLIHASPRQSAGNANNLHRQLTDTMTQLKRAIALFDEGPTSSTLDEHPRNHLPKDLPNERPAIEPGRRSQLAVTPPFEWIDRWEDAASTLLGVMRDAAEHMAHGPVNLQLHLFQRLASDITALREENSALHEQLIQLRREVATMRQELARGFALDEEASRTKQ